MLIKHWMSKDVITVGEDVSLEKASKLMKEHSIKHLPVMKNGRLTGIVSDRDLKEAKASNATALEKHELSYLLDQVKIKDLMTAEPFTTAADEIVERAANVMLENDISALPVVSEEGKLEVTLCNDALQFSFFTNHRE